MLLDLLHRRGTRRSRSAPASRAGSRSRLRTTGSVAALGAVAVLVASCAASVPERLNLPFGDAQQLIVVTAPGWGSTSGSLTTYEKVEGGWRIVQAALPVRIGRSGFSADHHEGDGTTPAGSFPVTGVMGRQPDPGVRYPYRQLVPGDCWISDATSPSYNQLVSASPCTKPNEDMYAIGVGPYRYLATVGYNVDPVVAGLGSAIFLHRHQYDGAGRTVPTSGCVSLSEPDLLTVLPWLDPSRHPRIVMGPDVWLIKPPSS